NEGRRVEGPIETNLEEADLLALFGEQVNCFFGRFCAGTHHDDDALGVGGTVVIEEMIGAAGLGGEAVHDGLDDSGYGFVERRAGFARLEEYVGVLRRATQDGTVRAERVLAELDDVLVVKQSADGLVADRV